MPTIWPLLGWYEREIMDLYGIRFHDHPEPNRLVLPQHVPPPLAPSGQDTAWVDIAPVAAARARCRRCRRKTCRFCLSGRCAPTCWNPPSSPFFISASRFCIITRICSSSIAAWKQRFEGADLAGGTILAERVSGVGTRGARAGLLPGGGARRRLYRAAARLLAARAAGGTGAGLQPPALPRASCHTTTLKVAEAQGKLLEERGKQINTRLTGSRFLRSLLIPGGLRRDLRPEAVAERGTRSIAGGSRADMSTIWRIQKAILTG